MCPRCPHKDNHERELLRDWNEASFIGQRFQNVDGFIAFTNCFVAFCYVGTTGEFFWI